MIPGKGVRVVEGEYVPIIPPGERFLAALVRFSLSMTKQIGPFSIWPAGDGPQAMCGIIPPSQRFQTGGEIRC